MSQSNFYALLVGVDRYKNPQQAPHLRGCVADVKGTYAFLTTRLGVPEENILLLTSSMDESEAPEHLATRENVIRGWQEHLAQAGAGDQVFFHYSGHGSQARSNDPNEPDGYDETIVPHDSRTPGVYDILDKELGALIDTVEAKEAYVTIFMDCCHSGSGTRAIARGEISPLVRRCPNDERQRPPQTIVAGAATRSARTRGVKQSPSGWEGLTGGHVLLAGCRDEELSHEYRNPETQGWNGATTYFLLKALSNYRQDMTWSEVHDFVQTNVRAVYPQQSPQLEGPANRTIFGGLTSAARPYLLVTEIDGDQHVKVNGGAAVGLSVDSRVAIYAPGDDMDGPPLAEGTVEQSKLDFAWAKLDEPLPADSQVQVTSRVKITALGYGKQSYTVAVDDEAVKTAMGKVADGEPSPFLEPISTAEADVDGLSTTFQVVAQDDGYAILDGTGTQIVAETPPRNEEGAQRVAKLLEHLAIYRNVQLLRNPAPTPLMQGAVSIEAVTYERLSRNYQPYDPEPLQEVGHETVLPPGRKLHLTVRNNTAEPIYMAVFNLTPKHGVYRIQPATRSFDKVAGGEAVYIPGIELDPESVTGVESKEIFKVFASREPLSFDVLQLPELDEGDAREAATRAAGPLADLLNAVRRDGSQTRKVRIDRDDTHDQWITEQLEVTMLLDTETKALESGRTSVEIGTPLDITVEKSTDFSGDLIISSIAQSSRGADIEEQIVLPPGLDNLDAAGIFQPLSLSADTRAVDRGSAGVLALNSEPSQLQSVSDENPLHLELTVEDEPDLQGILPIAFDGEFYYLAGQQAEARTRDVVEAGKRRMALEISHLPLPADAGEVGEGTRTAGKAPTRDLKRTVRLFLYKVIKKELPADTGVRKAHLADDGSPVYAAVSKADVEQANKVALLIHGFTSSTKWFVQRGWPNLSQLDDYDLLLTYDYETFGTSISENGQILARALKDLDFDAGDGVALDIYCHSLGTQVARVLVELAGGHEFVDRVFMGGAPNAGTPLAKGKNLVKWVGTILLNQAGLGPPAFIADWFLRKIIDSAVTVDDLMPDSHYYERINGPGQIWDVPYYVQIGTNSEADQPLDWNKLFSKSNIMQAVDIGLDKLFGGQNDLLVGVRSAQDVRGGDWPELTVAELPGNHFQYFVTEDSIDVFRQWIESGSSQ